METVRISVRDLVEFICRYGSIESGFGAGPTALEGTKIHQKIQRNEKDNYEAEVMLSHTTKYKDISIYVSGRADGIITEDGKITIDEIKSTAADLSRIKDTSFNLVHTAQVKCYAYFYALDNNLESISIRLTYYNIDTDEIKQLYETFTLKQLKTYYNKIIKEYYKFVKVDISHKACRDESIKTLSFPFDDYRPGQQNMMNSVYKTIENGNKLFVNAATGIGKTISTIYPAVKSMYKGHTSRIFYLTAKTITRTVAEDTFSLLESNGLVFKTITLTAKDKICFLDKTNCTASGCPFANGHLDRVNEALLDLITNEKVASRDIIEQYAKKHQVCPFEFQLDVSLFCDAIIGDYNYAFDPNASLKRFFTTKSDAVLLIDEAHNLIDRSREMFSAKLSKRMILDTKRLFKDKKSKLYKTINKLYTYFIDLKNDCEDVGFAVVKQPPTSFMSILESFINHCEVFLIEKSKDELYDALLALYFEALYFYKIYELYDENYTTYVEITEYDVIYKMFCLDPSTSLLNTYNKVKSTILFSATLLPIRYYFDLLGGKEEDRKLYFESPFDKDNCLMLVANNVSTKYIHRDRTYGNIVNYIKMFTSSRIGNYLVFFPSYKYMTDVVNLLEQESLDCNLYLQRSNMSEQERNDFLELFHQDNNKTNIFFSIAGGIFSEGIDLKGDALIGAIIVGVGLPQLGLERDIIKAFFDDNNLGYQYAYLYPGMNKVMQAVGRVIRTTTDIGAVLLIDNRYTNEDYISIMPEEWNQRIITNENSIESTLKEFWDLHK